jgi:hypothetical protein
MTKVAKHSGLSRASLYEALPGKRRPSFATILKGVSALGMRAISSAEAERSAIEGGQEIGIGDVDPPGSMLL